MSPAWTGATAAANSNATGTNDRRGRMGWLPDGVARSLASTSSGQTPFAVRHLRREAKKAPPKRGSFNHQRSIAQDLRDQARRGRDQQVAAGIRTHPAVTARRRGEV